MISFQNINTVAKYESKTLLRSWFFKIFAILALVILGLFHLFTNIEVDMPSLAFHALPANIPYSDIKFLNIIQSIIAIFLASNFLRKDAKLDTSVVIYVRPMSNAEYILGKAYGIFKLFMGLNILSLLTAFIINLTTTNSIPDIFSYIIYPIIISIPSIIFILGVSFALMVYIKNQAITFIILLGYIGICVFYLGAKISPIYDYTSFHLPLLYSDIIGFSNINEILMQRGGYLLCGLGFILLTIVKVNRIPHSDNKIKRYFIFSFLIVALGISSLSYLMINQFKIDSNRNMLSTINNRYYSNPNIDIADLDIKLKHNSNRIDCKATLLIKNNTKNKLKQYFLSLNTGLKVNNITQNGKNIDFLRDGNIIIIKENILSNSKISLNINYSGKINDNSCYLDIDSKNLKKSNNYYGFNIQKNYSFIKKNYVLLTPENNWYPTNGLRYNPKKPVLGRYHFTNYTLQVETNKDMIALSQGTMTTISKGKYLFKNKNPLPQISLVIGKYQQRSILVDSLECNISYIKEHDYFSPVFSELKDTIPFLLKEIITDYELKQKRNYPYRKISLIEVPAQFKTYNRLWTNHRETVQPEIVFLPELGFNLPNGDFEGNYKRIKKWKKRSGNDFNDKNVKINIFKRIINTLFFTDKINDNKENDDDALINTTSSVNDIYSLNPNFYTFVNYIYSDKYPIMSGIMEIFSKDEIQSRRSFFSEMRGGLNDQDKSNNILKDKSFSDIINNSKQYSDNLISIVHNKSIYFKYIITNKIKKEDLRESFTEFCDIHKFKGVNIDSLFRFLNKKYACNFNNQIEDWYNNSSIPGYIISSVKGYSVKTLESKKFQIKLYIRNNEPIGGLINLKIVLGRNNKKRGGRRNSSKRRDNSLDYSYYLEGNTSYEIGVVCDNKPVSLTINTLVSQNIPAKTNIRFEKFENSKDEPSNDIKKTNQDYKKNEIIVDNEDKGFKLIQNTKEKKLKKMLMGNKKNKQRYSAMEPWRPPFRWTLTTKESFYGKYIKSAYYIKSGLGNNKAIWTAEIKKAAYYDVFFYYNSTNMDWGRRMYISSRNNMRSNNTTEYNVFIVNDDGTTNSDLAINQGDSGWISLGSYYFSEGEAKVILTDKTTARSVIADAVKWVKKN